MDTSAWVALHKIEQLQAEHPIIVQFRSAVEAGQLRGSDAVKLELLHNAPSPAAVVAAEAELDRLQTLPITSNASRAAVGAIRDLAAAAGPGSPLKHRLSHLDALIAGSAWHSGFGVLHYDNHFDRLATVLAFDSVWITPRLTFANNPSPGRESG